MKMAGGLSREYFYPLKLRLFCYFSLRILATPDFRSLFKSAGLNYQFLLKEIAIFCSYWRGFGSMRER